MTHPTIVNLLQNITNAKRENRQKAAFFIVENPKFLKDLLTATFTINDKLSIRACWILEWVCTHDNLNHILPYLDIFTEKIATIHFDGVVRCCAKICEHLAIAYDSKEPNEVKQTLTETHIDNIITTGFDWLISDQKIAVKAYTMQTLYSLGKYRDWVHPELAHIIQTKVIHQSKGTKARGMKILSKLNQV